MNVAYAVTSVNLLFYLGTITAFEYYNVELDWFT